MFWAVEQFGRGMLSRAAAVLAAVVLASNVPAGAGQMIDSMYCGQENCYQVLGMDADSTTSDVKKAYRRLARVHHPDRKGGSSEAFQRVATAYETLSDDEARRNYDYYLANPGDAIYNQYRYYRHKTAPKVDVMPILVVMMTLISVCQYLYWNSRYTQAVSSAIRNPKIKNRAKQVAIDEGMLDGVAKERHDEILRKVVASKLDLHGSFAPANVMDVAWIQLIISPYTIAMYFWVKHVRWHYRYSINSFDVAEYEDDRDYMICRNMTMSLAKLNGMQEEDRNEILQEQCWIPANAAAYTKRKIEEAHEAMKNSTRYKWEKRWLKKNRA